MSNISTLNTSDSFKKYLDSIGVTLPFDEAAKPGRSSRLAQPHVVDGKTIGNSLAVLPMEGADGTTDGLPTEATQKRWQRFGQSGAKLIWGGEAAAVSPDCRGNPHQLLMTETTVDGMAGLRRLLVAAHGEKYGRTDDLMVGLQLTHAGRGSKSPEGQPPAPKILYRNPVMDRIYGDMSGVKPLTDADIQGVIKQFVNASLLAEQAGFDFVDIKHCHGSLGHEFLSAVDRPGRYGGSFENRTRFLREVVEGIRRKSPKLGLGVRLSAFDFLPYAPGKTEIGEPVAFTGNRYPYAFGGDGTGMGINLTEPVKFLELLLSLGVKLVCISIGASYNSHIMMPGPGARRNRYKSPEEPLIGVARHISVTAELKRRCPSLIYVGSSYSPLEHWLRNVAEGALRDGMVDIVGVGRRFPFIPDLLK
jgi:NADPH2 dehydrogenase